MASPKVSIGMPLYNAQRYLEETLDSILAQTFSDFELLIADNASTDRTAEICQRYAALDARIRLFTQETNLGAARNFNFVFEQAQGEYFRWCAYDDPIAPQNLERTVALLDSHPEAVMSYARTILIDKDGEVIEYHFDDYDLRSSRAHERFRKQFYSSAWCHPVFGLIRRELLANTGLIGAYASSDKVLLAELALVGQCHEVPEHLSYRRLHPKDSTTANPSDEAIAAWFDPSRKGFVLAPRWQRLLELVKALLRVPLSPWERLLCFLELGKFYLNPRRLPGAAKDLRQVSRRMTGSTVRSDEL